MTKVEFKGIKFLHVILRDINLRKKVENELKNREQELIMSNETLKQQNWEKDMFISILSHDLIGTLGNSKQIIQMLKAKDKSWPQREKFIDQLINNTETSYELLTKLVEWGKASLGKTKPSFVCFSIKRIFDDICTIYNPQLNQKNINMQKDCPCDLTIYADESMIETILRNLVKNAIKYTNPKGKIILMATQKNGYVEISVKDNGIGISKEKKDVLFSLSNVLSTKGTQGETGTGLGLQIVKEYIKIHGGEIWVESEQNKGTKITFTIPDNNNE